MKHTGLFGRVGGVEARAAAQAEKHRALGDGFIGRMGKATAVGALAGVLAATGVAGAWMATPALADDGSGSVSSGFATEGEDGKQRADTGVYMISQEALEDPATMTVAAPTAIYVRVALDGSLITPDVTALSFVNRSQFDVHVEGVSVEEESDFTLVLGNGDANLGDALYAQNLGASTLPEGDNVPVPTSGEGDGDSAGGDSAGGAGTSMGTNLIEFLFGIHNTQRHSFSDYLYATGDDCEIGCKAFNMTAGQELGLFTEGFLDFNSLSGKDLTSQEQFATIKWHFMAGSASGHTHHVERTAGDE